MPLYLKNTQPLFGIWKIEETKEELLDLLDKKERYIPYLEKKTNESRKKEWLAVRVLLKELLRKEVEIHYHKNGAPYLLNASTSISISHTKGYVAVIISNTPYTGIDIEYRSDRILKICSRFLNEEENQNLDVQNKVDHALIYWCAKETLFKMIPEQEIDFANHLHIQPFQYTLSGVLNAIETRTKASQRFQLNYLVTPEFVMTYNNE